MAHRNARLTPVTRGELVRQVAVGWTQAEVARQFRVSRAAAAFARQGVVVRRVLTDNAKAYSSEQFRKTAQRHGITLKLTRPYRHQTNGKAEHFIQAPQNEWAYARRYRSNPKRLRPLVTWLDHLRSDDATDSGFRRSRMLSNRCRRAASWVVCVRM
jgi:transposase InsO family protein